MATDTTPDQPPPGSPVQRIKAIGGLVAVAIGVVAVAGIAIGALIAGSEIAATVASSSAGVIGSIVGAFFGVKIGTDQMQDAVKGERAAAARAQVYAAHLPPEEAPEILKMAHAVARGEPFPQKGPPRPPTAA